MLGTGDRKKYTEFSKIYSLIGDVGLCFSNFKVHRNHLASLLKCSFCFIGSGLEQLCH